MWHDSTSIVGDASYEVASRIFWRWSYRTQETLSMNENSFEMTNSSRINFGMLREGGSHSFKNWWSWYTSDNGSNFIIVLKDSLLLKQMLLGLLGPMWMSSYHAVISKLFSVRNDECTYIDWSITLETSALTSTSRRWKSNRDIRSRNSLTSI